MIRVWWQTSLQPHGVETSPRLGADASWALVQAQPVTQAEYSYVDLRPEPPGQFYRLRFAPLPQNVSISDSTFKNDDWDTIVFASTAESSASAFQAMDGGGNPDPYMQIVQSLGGGPPSTVRSIHIRKLPYDPHTQGAIVSILYSEEARVISTEANTFGGSTGPALRQNGKIYIASATPVRDDPGGPLPSPYKQIQLVDLSASSFNLLIGPEQIDSSQHPDFSGNGSPIEFGFVRANSHTFSFQTTRTTAIDNWSVLLKPAY